MSVATDQIVADSVLDYGDQALLSQFDSSADVLAATAALRDAVLPGVLDIVPAARTVLVKLEGNRYQGVTRHRLRKLHLKPVASAFELATDPVLRAMH